MKCVPRQNFSAEGKRSGVGLRESSLLEQNTKQRSDGWNQDKHEVP